MSTSIFLESAAGTQSRSRAATARECRLGLDAMPRLEHHGTVTVSFLSIAMRFRSTCRAFLDGLELPVDDHRLHPIAVERQVENRVVSALRFRMRKTCRGSTASEATLCPRHTPLPESSRRRAPAAAFFVAGLPLLRFQYVMSYVA